MSIILLRALTYINFWGGSHLSLLVNIYPLILNIHKELLGISHFYLYRSRKNTTKLLLFFPKLTKNMTY